MRLRSECRKLHEQRDKYQRTYRLYRRCQRIRYFRFVHQWLHQLYTGGATANDTLFNFGSAATLTTTGMTIYGSVLGPQATFTGSNGSIDGELIAGSVTGETAELESGDIFSGNLGTLATPEPSAWILMAIAIIPCGLFGARRTAVSRP